MEPFHPAIIDNPAPKRCRDSVPIGAFPDGPMLRNVTRNRKKQLGVAILAAAPRVEGSSRDEPQTKLRSEANLILCFQQKEEDGYLLGPGSYLGTVLWGRRSVLVVCQPRRASTVSHGSRAGP